MFIEALATVGPTKNMPALVCLIIHVQYIGRILGQYLLFCAVKWIWSKVDELQYIAEWSFFKDSA